MPVLEECAVPAPEHKPRSGPALFRRACTGGGAWRTPQRLGRDLGAQLATAATAEARGATTTEWRRDLGGVHVRTLAQPARGIRSSANSTAAHDSRMATTNPSKSFWPRRHNAQVQQQGIK